MHASLTTNARLYRLKKMGDASMNNAELAEALDLKIRPRGGTRGYHIGDSFFYDDEGNIAMIRVTREVVAVAHLYQRVGVALTTVLDAVRIDAAAEIFAAEPM